MKNADRPLPASNQLKLQNLFWTILIFFWNRFFFFYFYNVIHIGEKNNITNAYRKITLNLSSWILKKETEQGKKNNQIAWKH